MRVSSVSRELERTRIASQQARFDARVLDEEIQRLTNALADEQAANNDNNIISSDKRTFDA